MPQEEQAKLAQKLHQFWVELHHDALAELKANTDSSYNIVCYLVCHIVFRFSNILVNSLSNS
jgi:hypothetical protein